MRRCQPAVQVRSDDRGAPAFTLRGFEGRELRLTMDGVPLDLTYAYAVRSDTPKVAILPGESAEVQAGREALKLFHLEVPRIPANWSAKPAG